MGSGRQSHAYIIVGPSGVGRLELARELAAALLCAEGGTEKCGRCRSCRALQSASHPDYEELAVPEDKTKISLKTVQAAQDRAALKPAISRRRVFVVCDAERMSIEAANCFLKTLEEPPGEACFILIAATLWNLPETVVSRCQVVKLAGLPSDLVAELLAREGVAREDASWLARRAWGSPGLARAFAEMDLHGFNRELADSVMAMGPGEALDLTDQVCGHAVAGGESRAQSRLLLQELLECLAVLYRDAAVLAVADGEVELFNAALEDQLRPFAQRCGAEFLVECGARILEAIDRIGGNANQTLAVDNLFAGLSGVVPARPS